MTTCTRCGATFQEWATPGTTLDAEYRITTVSNPAAAPTRSGVGPLEISWGNYRAMILCAACTASFAEWVAAGCA